MRILRFERLNQIITISAVRIDNRVLERITVRDNLIINFSDYVKSQLHLNLVTDFFGRDIVSYYNAYQYIMGDKTHYRDCLKVIKFFYTDMANFLCNNPDPVDLSLIIDIDGFKSLDLENGKNIVKEELLSILSIDNSKDLFDKIKSSEYSFIIDYADDKDDLEKKINNYSLAGFIFNSLSGGFYESTS